VLTLDHQSPFLHHVLGHYSDPWPPWPARLTAVQLLIEPLVKAAPLANLAPEPLVIGATVAASCAFLLPVSTTPNAVVFSSGRVSVREMARAGVWLNVVSVLLMCCRTALYYPAGGCPCVSET